MGSARVALEPISEDDGDGVHHQQQTQQHDDAGRGVLGEGGLRPRHPVEDLNRQNRERRPDAVREQTERR